MRHPDGPPEDPDRWARVERIFEEVADLPDGQQEAALAVACGRDLELRRLVGRLLHEDRDRQGLLDAPLAFLGAGLLSGAPSGETASPLDDSPGTPPHPPDLLPGTRLGPWRIVELVGEGGMGSVYRARRDDGAFEQEVALKRVRGGRIARALEGRFLRERRILALLEHPGIARLVDGGVAEDGSPWLAMEFVEGEPITRWAERTTPGLEARLQVFLMACEAVQYAHSRLVVHRDLKPSNILVTSRGDVRLLDFGIARLLSGDEGLGLLDPGEPGETDPLTRAGMLLLTPEFAAPEQLRGEPATTTTDVWALGAILHTLLAGQPPFLLRVRSWSDIARLLQEEAPPLTRTAGMDPALRRRLRGDLETIVLKALHRDPLRRYGSVEALADDVRRFLEGRPVRARPDTLGYRLSRFVRRNRLAVGAAGLLVLSVAAGTGATLAQSRATRAEALGAEALSGFLLELFDGADPFSNGGQVPDAVQLLDRGAERIRVPDEAMRPHTRVDLLNTMGMLYRRLGMPERSIDHHREAEALARSRLGAGDTRTGLALVGLTAALQEAGDYEAAAAEGLRAVEVLRTSGATDTVLAEALSALGVVESMAGRPDQAVEHHREALALDEIALGRGDHDRVATDLHNLGMALAARDEEGDEEAADRLLLQGLEMKERLLGPDHPSVAVSLGGLAQLRGRRGALEEARDLHARAGSIYRTSLGPDHPDLAGSLGGEAVYLGRLGRTAEADSLYREALEIQRRTLGADHLLVATTLNNLAVLRYQTGQWADAASAQQEVVDTWVRTLGREHTTTGTGFSNLGAMLLAAGELDAAEGALQEALAIQRAVLPDPAQGIGVVLRNLGDLERARGRHREAIPHYAAALEQFAGLPPDHWRRGDALLGAGISRMELGLSAEALVDLEEALRLRSGAFGDLDPRTLAVQLWLGIARARGGDPSAAALHLQATVQGFEAAGTPAHPDAARARLELDRLPPPPG